MSCFICSFTHICMLAAYATGNRLYEPTRYTPEDTSRSDLELTARALYAANVHAYRTRYPHDPVVECFKLAGGSISLARKLTPIQVVKAAQCFEYQACEADYWEGSVLAGAVQAILCHAITQVPGYTEAAWDIPGE